MPDSRLKQLGCYLVLCLSSASGSAEANGQNWLANTFKWKVNQSVQAGFSQEIRSDDVAAYDHIVTKYLELTVRHAPGKTFYWAARYRHQWNLKQGSSIEENRWVLEGGAMAKARSWLSFDVRFRFDGKNFDSPGPEDYEWYRLRLRSTAKARLGRLRISPFLALEPFGDTRSNTKTFINRHRLYLGAGFPAGNHLYLAIDYIRQDIRNDGTDHILRTQIEWTI